jgi:uncharacterized protein with von Willebrand factor type A (vWA) domain
MGWPRSSTVDLAAVAAAFGAALHAAGLPVGPDRVTLFTRAVTIAAPRTIAELRACARATLVIGEPQIALLDRIFDAVFAGLQDVADERGQAGEEAIQAAPEPAPGQATISAAASAGGVADGGASAGDKAVEVPVPSAASGLERLQHREFSELTPDELRVLAAAMSQLRLATPLRRSRRTAISWRGDRPDLRRTLRLAMRTGAEPMRLLRRRARRRARRLVVLCDISGSMEPYARAMLQLLYFATGTAKAEVFTFATRLTRLTTVLARQTPAQALAQAGTAVPDWSGGTRIGAALKEFLDRYGRPGLARGAVVVIISDGWETGDPGLLGAQMARLSRLAYRIVWVNPRTQSDRYQPLVGGMAAAWPYCDAVVSAHRMDALDALIDAVGATRR